MHVTIEASQVIVISCFMFHLNFQTVTLTRMVRIGAIGYDMIYTNAFQQFFWTGHGP